MSRFRPNLPLTIVMIVSLMGLTSLSRLLYEPLKRKTYNGLLIRINTTGADAFKSEELVTFPIENSVSSLGGLVELRSVTEVGLVNIYLQFQDGIDIKSKAMEVRERIDSVAQKFPKDFHRPELLKYNPNDMPVFIASFSHPTFSATESKLYLEKYLKPRIETLNAVNLVEVIGGELEEIQVYCDPFQLETYQLSLLDIVNRIQDANRSIRVGDLPINSESIERISLSLTSRFRDLKDILKLPISVRSFPGSALLEDICSVQIKSREPTSSSRINGKEYPTIYIFSNNNQDFLSLSDQIQSELELLNKAGFEFTIRTDLSESVRKKVVFWGRILILILIFLLVKISFGSLIATFHSLITLFLSLCIMLFLHGLLKLQLNDYSAFAFIFSTFIFLMPVTNRGKGVKSYFPHLVQVNVILYILIFAFFSRDYLFYVAIFFLVFWGNLLLLVYIFPFVQKAVLIPDAGKDTNRLRYALRIDEYIQDWLQKKIHTTRKKYLGDIYLFPLTLVFLCTLGLYFFWEKVTYTEGYLEGDQIFAYIDYPSGSSFSYVNSLSQNIESKISKLSEVKDVVSKVESEKAILVITLRSLQQINESLLNSIQAVAEPPDDAYFSFADQSKGKGNSEYSIDVTGQNLSILEEITSRLVAEVKTLDGVDDVVLKFKPSREELEILFRKDKFEYSKISFLEFGEQLRTAIQGSIATKVFLYDKEIDLRVRYKDEFRQGIRDLNFYKVKNVLKDFIPVDQIVDVNVRKVPTKIYHKDKTRSLSFVAKTKMPPFALKKAVNEILEGENIPKDYQVKMNNSADQRIERPIFERLLFLFVIFSSIVYHFFKESLLRLIRKFCFLFFFFFTFVAFSVLLFDSPFSIPFQISFLLMITITDTIGIRFFVKRNLKYSLAGLVVVNLITPPQVSEVVLIGNSFVLGIFLYRFLYQLGSKWEHRHSLVSLFDPFRKFKSAFSKLV